MSNLASFDSLLRYSDWANTELFRAAGPLSDSKLDQPFEMGIGSLRRTLLHIWAGESVWTSRIQGKAETPWPDQEEKASPAAMFERLRAAWSERDRFLATVNPADVARPITYRDSKGSLFRASLADMMTQMIIHSTHHRAQVANMLRHLAGITIDLDYMYWVRVPA